MGKFYIFLSVFILVGGYFTKYKKMLWFHQGMSTRKVDVDKYTNYMGSIDMIFGTILLVLGVTRLFIKIYASIVILAVIYFVLCIYGEIKYKA